MSYTNLFKVIRFIGIYGFDRVLFKVLGRLRIKIPILSLKRRSQTIGMVGCGQFAFATIGYFILRGTRHTFVACYDVSSSAQKSFERAYGINLSMRSFNELIAFDNLKLMYIASNHASHADYAAQAMSRGIDVYIEKPIAVRYDQLVDLVTAKQRFPAKAFAGYNRPFSSAIRDLRHEITIDSRDGISIQCFVSGHVLKEDHWYRRPEEGTRVCGNLGHWLDLFIHILAWRGLPDKLEITLIAASEQEPDDNMVVTMRSDRHDIFSVMLASHSEPFEGINETINIQHGETICKIDDFRRMTIWQGARLLKRRYWPKDVGHKQAILQPFQDNFCRDWNEVVLSTLLMLHITEMVRQDSQSSTFSCFESQQQLKVEVDRRLLLGIK
jgi:predicted dehydrogenase